MTRIIASTVRYAVAQLRESLPDIHPVVVKILLEDPTPRETLLKLSLDYLVLHKGVECQILNLIATLVHQPSGSEATRLVASILRELGLTPSLPSDRMWARVDGGPWFLTSNIVYQGPKLFITDKYETQDREFALWDVWLKEYNPNSLKTGLTFGVHGLPGLKMGVYPDAQVNASIVSTYFTDGIDAAKVIYEDNLKLYGKEMPSFGWIGMAYALWCESTWALDSDLSQGEWLRVETMKKNLFVPAWR